MKVDHFLPGSITMVTYAERLTCSGAGYVRDQRSAGVNSLPADQSDQSVLLENDIIIHNRSHGAQIMRVFVHKATNLLKCI